MGIVIRADECETKTHEAPGWNITLKGKNMISASDDNSGLGKLLQEWTLGAPLPAHFQEQVWRRVALAEAGPWLALGEVFVRWLEGLFSRPALAVCYVVVLLFAGATTGYVQAQHTSMRAGAHWRALYVQSVDPYQVPRN